MTSTWRFIVSVVTSCGTLEIFRRFCVTWCLHLPYRMRRKLPLEGRYMSTSLPGITPQKKANFIFITSEYDGSDFACALYLHTCTFPFFYMLPFPFKVKFYLLHSYYGHIILQDCTNSGHQIAGATKFCTMPHNTVCPIRYRTRHFFNNFTTNEDIATKLEADLPQCVRHVTTS